MLGSQQACSVQIRTSWNHILQPGWKILPHEIVCPLSETFVNNLHTPPPKSGLRQIQSSSAHVYLGHKINTCLHQGISAKQFAVGVWYGNGWRLPIWRNSSGGISRKSLHRQSWRCSSQRNDWGWNSRCCQAVRYLLHLFIWTSCHQKVLKITVTEPVCHAQMVLSPHRVSKLTSYSNLDSQYWSHNTHCHKGKLSSAS